MPKFWYENILMRFSYGVAFFAFISVFLYALGLEGRRDEEAVNRAFQQAVINDLGSPGLESIPLDKPHRADRELKGWISGAVSESFSVDPLAFDELKETVKGYFTSSGFQQYEDYLNSTGMLQNLKSSNSVMNVFLEEQPLLLNSSEVDSVYRWLYQVPVTLSFIPRNQVGAGSSIRNQKISLRVQIRRASAKETPHEMQIERWDVTARR